MARALIGLGSNLGDRAALLGSALVAMAETEGVRLLVASRPIETPPVGGPEGQGPFLNAAAAVETTLPPEALLRALRSIEEEAGRVRTVRWGERTLDLDLLMYDDRVIRTPSLTVPHPRMALRRFVLAPLTEIAPDVVDPLTGRTVAALLANLDRRPGHVAIGEAAPGALVQALCRRLPAIELRLDPEGSRPGDPGERTAADPPDWRVSRVGPDATDPPRSRGPSDRRMQEMTEELPPPTFVVLTTGDRARREAVGGDRPSSPWVGTPVLEVESYDSEATVREVLDACAATRAGSAAV